MPLLDVPLPISFLSVFLNFLTNFNKNFQKVIPITEIGKYGIYQVVRHCNIPLEVMSDEDNEIKAMKIPLTCEYFCL